MRSVHKKGEAMESVLRREGGASWPAKGRHLQATKLGHLQRAPSTGDPSSCGSMKKFSASGCTRIPLPSGDTPLSTATLPLPVCWWCGNSFGFPIGSRRAGPLHHAVCGAGPAGAGLHHVGQAGGAAGGCLEGPAASGPDRRGGGQHGVEGVRGEGVECASARQEPAADLAEGAVPLASQKCRIRLCGGQLLLEASVLLMQPGVLLLQPRDTLDRLEQFVLQRRHALRQMLTVQTRGCFPHLPRAARYPFPFQQWGTPAPRVASRTFLGRQATHSPRRDPDPIGCPLKARILENSWAAGVHPVSK
jgi:hypothetical protein